MFYVVNSFLHFNLNAAFERFIQSYSIFSFIMLVLYFQILLEYLSGIQIASYVGSTYALWSEYLLGSQVALEYWAN